MTLVSGNINYFYLYVRKRFSDNCRQTGVGWLKSTNLQFSRRYIVSEIRFDIAVHYDNNPFWISADTDKDDLE